MNKKIKILLYSIMFIVFIVILFFIKDIFILGYSKLFNKEVFVLDKANEYYKNIDYIYVQDTTNTKPSNRQELLNLFYSILNRGYYNFNFYCDSNYKTCIDDVKEMAKDNDILSTVNNYVHPYNRFIDVDISYRENNMIFIDFQKAYTIDEMNIINAEVNRLYNVLVDSNDSDYNNILKIHDYIINNSKFDNDRVDYKVSNYKSQIAYGPLFDGYAICSGYTDLMQLFLEKMNIPNYRVATEDHIWNAVYLDNKWVNLDLTWDDPVVDDGKDYLEHDFFLVDTNTLLLRDKSKHSFILDYYKELKNT